MYITSADHAEAVGWVHGETFAEVRPAAPMVVVAALLDPRWCVGVEVEAVVDRCVASLGAHSLEANGTVRAQIDVSYGWSPGPPWLWQDAGRSAWGPVHWPLCPAPLPPLVGGGASANAVDAAPSASVPARTTMEIARFIIHLPPGFEPLPARPRWARNSNLAIMLPPTVHGSNGVQRAVGPARRGEDEPQDPMRRWALRCGTRCCARPQQPNLTDELVEAAVDLFDVVAVVPVPLGHSSAEYSSVKR
jgi:hypothetical protein